MRNAVLAVLAHPDDAEFLCVGTMLRLAREHGWELHVATMTPGDCGSADLPPDEIARVRRAEGAAAAAAVGGTYHCLEERDLRVVYAGPTVEKVARLINAVAPRVVLTHSPDDYHLDHEQTSKVVRAATFAAPIPNFLHGTHAHPPLAHIPHLYYCDPLDGTDAFGQPIPAGFRIDISGVIEDKATALAAHASQRDWLAKHHGVDEFTASMRRWSATQGKAAGVAFAEGFRQHKGHSYPQDNLLGELLSAVRSEPEA